MEIKELAAEYEGYIIDKRRAYHRSPELSGQEEQTRRRLRQDLEDIGISDITEMKHCYGMTAVIHGGHPGRTIALRTDMDALPIHEKSKLPFASDNGAMHACGHDSHMAMLLGAAKILYQLREELHGNVLLLFQPAEEIAAGAQWMLREGALEGVDAVYGAHVWGTLDAPFIDVESGNRMAGSQAFTITVEGKSAHGSEPHLGVDAIMAACSIAQNLQQCVSRMNNPLNPLVLTIATFHAGTCWNLIANTVRMEGTVRSFSRDETVEHHMRQVVEQTAAALGASAKLEYVYKTSPVVNDDAELNQIAKQAVVKLYGEESLKAVAPLMSSEDFSAYGQRIPSFFAFIGCKNEAKGIVEANHHEAFTVDESVLKRGAAVMAQVARDYLENSTKA